MMASNINQPGLTLAAGLGSQPRARVPLPPLRLLLEQLSPRDTGGTQGDLQVAEEPGTSREAAPKSLCSLYLCVSNVVVWPKAHTVEPTPATGTPVRLMNVGHFTPRALCVTRGSLTEIQLFNTQSASKASSPRDAWLVLTHTLQALLMLTGSSQPQPCCVAAALHYFVPFLTGCPWPWLGMCRRNSASAPAAGVADAPEGHSAFLMNLNRLEKWANRNFMKFNKKCKVLALERIILMHP